MTQSGNRVLTVLSAFLGLAMIGAGATKLMGLSAEVAAFTVWGLPPWFRALIGTFEVSGGVLLMVPATRPAGSVILSTIMVGALWAHAASGEWPHLIPVVVLLALFLTIFMRNRARAIQLLGGA